MLFKEVFAVVGESYETHKYTNSLERSLSWEANSKLS